MLPLLPRNTAHFALRHGARAVFLSASEGSLCFKLCATVNLSGGPEAVERKLQTAIAHLPPEMLKGHVNKKDPTVFPRVGTLVVGEKPQELGCTQGLGRGASSSGLKANEGGVSGLFAGPSGDTKPIQLPAMFSSADVSVLFKVLQVWDWSAD